MFSAIKSKFTLYVFYNLELMIKSVLRKGDVLLCGTCMDARGFTDEDVIEGTQRITMAELAQRTLAADKVLVFLNYEHRNVNTHEWHSKNNN